MRKTWILSLLAICMSHTKAQLNVNYDPEIQSKENIQYFTPKGDNLFVGDCIPYFHDGTYYLYWLVDKGHHSALNGLGGHQWTVSTSNDLKHWTHYPISIGIDEEWEKSICTGSVEHFGNTFYAFYATRLIDSLGNVNEQLSYATSPDALHFNKQKPNPFYTSAPGYNKRDFRDPKVIVDKSGVFHLFVSSSSELNSSIDENRGCLVHLLSSDLKSWKVNESILTGQRHVPECPDYFYWNKWYYLVYSQAGNTFYLMSRNPYGPWQQPKIQAFDEDWSNVVKTAEFTNGRRIAASWIPSKRGNKDDAGEMFGGCILLREVVQLKDGTLVTRFPEETLPVTGSELNLNPVLDSTVRKTGTGNYSVDARGAIGSLHADNIPVNSRITLEIDPLGNNDEVGLFIRSGKKASEGYKVSFSASKQTVWLGNTRIESVTGLDKPFTVDIILKDDIIDLCINHQRCIVNRLPERNGESVWFFAKQGKAVFKNIRIFPILK